KDEEGEEPDQVAIGVVEKVVQLVCRAITQQTPDQLDVESFVLIAQVGEALNLAYLGSEQPSAFDQTMLKRSRHAVSFVVYRERRAVLPSLSHTERGESKTGGRSGLLERVSGRQSSISGYRKRSTNAHEA